MLTSEYLEPSLVLSSNTSTPPSVLKQKVLSPQEKYELYAVLQEIANELRRIDREHKKHHSQASNK